MLVYSFTRRAVYVCPRCMIKRLKGTCAFLRHFAARVKLRHQIDLANSAQFARLPLSSKLTQITSYQTFKPHISSRTMSDDAYSSFLDQANQDTGASKASTKPKSAATKAVDTDVPVTLQKVDQYYTSEADEPFEPVSLKWGGKNMPSESMQPQWPPFQPFRPERCECTLTTIS